MRSSAPLLALALLATTGCREAPPEPMGGERVENAELGLAIAALPAAFEVDANQGATLRFTTTAEGDDGVLSLEAGPEQSSGINLVEEVKQRKAAFEAAPGGSYFGNRELLMPHGPAFTARGGYAAESGPVEETWVYTLHPAANRLVTVVYRYAGGGDPQARVGELIEFLGEIEALPAAGGNA